MPAITAIYGEAVRNGTASFELDPPDEAEMRRRFDAVVTKGYPYLCADAPDGAVGGYAYAGPYHTRPAYRWTVENSVYIAPSARGRKLGQALTRELVERCVQLGFRGMVAIIGGADHMASIRMHERLGFVHIGTMPATGFKHGRWLDTVMMHRPLGEGRATDPDPHSYPGTLYPAR